MLCSKTNRVIRSPTQNFQSNKTTKKPINSDDGLPRAPYSSGTDKLKTGSSKETFSKALENFIPIPEHSTAKVTDNAKQKWHSIILTRNLIKKELEKSACRNEEKK